MAILRLSTSNESLARCMSSVSTPREEGGEESWGERERGTVTGS